jgi:hypothetical protein
MKTLHKTGTCKTQRETKMREKRNTNYGKESLRKIKATKQSVKQVTMPKMHGSINTWELDKPKEKQKIEGEERLRKIKATR